MTNDPFKVVRDFEAALCEYTGAPYCVTTTSCTMALLLAVAWAKGRAKTAPINAWGKLIIEIPKRTYVGVAMSIIHAGGWPTFRDEGWIGWYQLKPLPVWDSARWLSGNLYNVIDAPSAPRVLPRGAMVCVSFHHTKTLGLANHGGAILHDNPEADEWLRRARFDGRAQGVPPKDDPFPQLGWHCYLTPQTAAEGLQRLAVLPRYNEPLPNDPYPDLSLLEIFK